jgi:hypothetical protein
MGTLNVMAIEKGMGICPAAPLREPVPDAGNGQGTADKAWVRWTSDERTKFFGSYGFISWQYTRAQNQIPLSFNGEANIQQPSTTSAFADTNWVDGNPAETEPPFHDCIDAVGLVRPT